MNLKQYLEHHGITSNPFADEDAQTDLVFKSHCIESTYHPTWDKIYGNPAEPATAVVFGEKGAGKTAMRLQIAQHLKHYNQKHPNAQVFAVEYDDFNPFLDEFRDRFRIRKHNTERILEQWKLWDHMDAILSLATTQLVDRILGTESTQHYPAAVQSNSDTLKQPAKKTRPQPTSRPATLNRMLRPIDRSKRPGSLEPTLSQAPFPHLEVEMGHRPANPWGDCDGRHHVALATLGLAQGQVALSRPGRFVLASPLETPQGVLPDL